MSRADAEEQLMQPFNDCGSFLIRDSDVTPGEYSLSVRDTEYVKHYRIRKRDNCGYFVTLRITFEDLASLVSYYRQQSDGLCITLGDACLLAEKPQAANLSTDVIDPWEIDRRSICFVKKLGAGQFAEVWEGLWNNTTQIAVKKLKPSTMSPQDFLEEAQLMKKLRHPKLIQLYALCTQEKPTLIITELMKPGNLLEYLRGDGRSLKLPQLIDMGAQVADGMAYFEQNNFIHRDLSASNILVGENLICKVAGFGLARVVDEDIYEAAFREKFAVKWTAPEGALYHRFTIKSDVWSFGIFLYELITYGRPPYPGISNTQILDMLCSGYRMPRPMGCPEQLYKIMSECWRGDSTSRPTFNTLEWRLHGKFTH